MSYAKISNGNEYVHHPFSGSLFECRYDSYDYAKFETESAEIYDPSRRPHTDGSKISQLAIEKSHTANAVQRIASD